MKILQIIWTLDPSYGGPVEGAIQQGSEFNARGHTVHVATLDRPGTRISDRLHEDNVFQLGPRRLKYGLSFRLAPWLLSHGKQYDIFVVHGIWQYHGYCVRKVARALGVPYVVFTHGALDPWFKEQYPLKHLKKWLYWPWGEYRVLRDAAFVFFTTNEELILARQSFWLYKVREKMVGYGIASRNIPPLMARAFFLARFPHLRDKRIILYLSRLHPKKGCDLLVRAFARIADIDPRLHLVLAGPEADGYGKQLLEDAKSLDIDSRITFAGMVEAEVKWGAYDSAEVFVLPSHQENFGIVVAESLASGIPVLTTNKVNTWREIQSEGAGIIDMDTQAGIERLLQGWLDMSSEERRQMSGRALGCFRSNFDIEQVIHHILRALDEAIRKPKIGFTYANSSPWLQSTDIGLH